MRHLLCCGATSDIAVAYLIERAREGGWRFTLVARNREGLSAVDRTLTKAGASVATVVCDFAEREQVLRFAAGLVDVGDVDEALIAFARLDNQTAVGADQGVIADQFDLNLTHTALLCEALAERLIAQQGTAGRLVVIGSTAADRPRPTNYAYSATKAGLEFFCDGLAYHCAKAGVQVTLVKPGLTDSAMTRAAARPQTLMVPPERVARDMVRAVDAGRRVLYTPWFWSWITLAGRLLPRRLMAKVSQ